MVRAGKCLPEVEPQLLFVGPRVNEVASGLCGSPVGWELTDDFSERGGGLLRRGYFLDLHRFGDGGDLNGFGGRHCKASFESWDPVNKRLRVDLQYALRGCIYTHELLDMASLRIMF